MLKNRIKRLLIYCVIFSMLIQNLLCAPIIVEAVEPGVTIKEEPFVYGETMIIDSRYIYRIKISDFIEYSKKCFDDGFFYNYEDVYDEDEDRIKKDQVKATSLEHVDWDNIADFTFYITTAGYQGLGDYSRYDYDTSYEQANVRATIDGEYLVFDFGSWGAYDTYITHYKDSDIGKNMFHTFASSTYDEEMNTLAINLYKTSNHSYHDDFTWIENYEDYKYVYSMDIGYEVYPNEVIIYEHGPDTFHSNYENTIYVKVVDEKNNEIDLTNTCYISGGTGFTAVSSARITGFLNFDDTYSKYTLIDVKEMLDEDGDLQTYHIFAVDSSELTDVVFYLDYLTGDLLYVDEILTPEDEENLTLYQDSNYTVWVDENENIITDNDLHSGMVVRGLPNETYIYVKDEIDSNNSGESNYILQNISNAQNTSELYYIVDNSEYFNPNNYNVFGWRYSDNINNVYLTKSYQKLIKDNYFSISNMKEYNGYSLSAINSEYINELYDGETGALLTPSNDIKWILTEIDGKSFDEFDELYNVHESKIKYKLEMSDEDKANYPSIFAKNTEKNAHYIYNGEEVEYKSLSVWNGGKKVINANQIKDDATCTENGSIQYEISYNFSTEHRIDIWQDEIIDVDIYGYSNNYIYQFEMNNTNGNTTHLYHQPYRDNFSIRFNTITSFDVFANPYMLSEYGVKQYESLYVLHSDLSGEITNSVQFEFYPTYENNELVYNVKYNNDLSVKNGDWDNELKFSNNAEGIKAYNDWVNSLPKIDKTTYRGFKFNNYTYVAVSNKNNPLNNISDNLRTQYNSMKFTLQESNVYSGVRALSTFHKNSNTNGVYVYYGNVFSAYPYTSTPFNIDALGHSLTNGEWTEVDVNNILNNTEIINANSNVVDLDTLIEYAENDIDKTLLNDNNNKLYYKLCDRAGDAYELSVNHTHSYGNPTFTWNEDYTECEAKFTCTSGDSSHTTDCIITSKRTEPNCTENGKITYTATVEFNNQNFTDTREASIEKNGHTYNEPIFTWNDDNSCDATFECIKGDDTKTVECTITSTTSNATCTVDGKTIYTATVTFNDKTYTDTKEVVIGVLGHTYNYPTFTWDKENNCKATFVCQKNDDTQVLDCTITSKITNPLCITKGKIVYTAKVTFEGNEYTDTKEVDIIPNGHKYKEPVFNWSEDYSDCTAVFDCESADDTQILDCTVTSTKSNPTCTVDGKIIYTATVEFEDVIYTDTKEIVIGASGHTYNHPTFTWDDNNDCIATFKCVKNDDTKNIDCEVTSTTINPSCTVNGKTVYTASVIFNNTTYTDTKEIIIKALNHEFGSWHEVKAPTYDEDGLLQRDCIRNDKSETKVINKLIKTATVNGMLKDENGKPIANKKVEMHSNPRYTYTDENGYFEFKDVELGEHTLKVFNTNNVIICELALTLDKVESSVEEKQVDDGFKWDKKINESDVSLTIDGLKNEVSDDTPDDSVIEDDGDEKPETSEKDNHPDTGDKSCINIYITLVMLSIMAYSFVVTALKKEK